MSAIEPIASVEPLITSIRTEPSVFSAGVGTAGGPSASFGTLISEGLQDLNQKLMTSEVALQRLAAGDTQNLHQLMIRLEESRLALQLGLQVRNRVLEAYQDVSRMQV